jgi:hypothetical protein
LQAEALVADQQVVVVVLVDFDLRLPQLVVVEH